MLFQGAFPFAGDSAVEKLGHNISLILDYAKLHVLDLRQTPLTIPCLILEQARLNYFCIS